MIAARQPPEGPSVVVFQIHNPSGDAIFTCIGPELFCSTDLKELCNISGLALRRIRTVTPTMLIPKEEYKGVIWVLGELVL